MLKMIVLSLVFSVSAFAHDGDHGPSMAAAQKGGIIKSLETVHLELVFKDYSISIFPFENTPNNDHHQLKPAQPSQFPVSANLELPRAKPSPLNLKVVGDHWEAAVDHKGSHRFTVVLSIRQGGHDDKVKWTVEPKK